jgi:hypothetical protein
VSPTGLSPVVSGDCCATATDDKSVSEIVTEKKIDRIEILPSKSKAFTPSPPSSQRQRSPSRSEAIRRLVEVGLKAKGIDDQIAFYGSSLTLPKLSITRETSFPALTTL